MACITRFLPTAVPESRNLFASGRCWAKLTSLLGERPVRGLSSAAEKEEEEPKVSLIDEELDEESVRAQEEARINKIRNISRLRPHDRDLLHRQVPTVEEEKKLPMHYTVRYNKRLYGRYGWASGVDPGLCWPTKEELEDRKEYESLAFSHNILEVAARAAEKKAELERQKLERDEEVVQGVKKMLQKKDEYLKRVQKQKQEAEAAKAFKKRLIEEVRLHFNYTVNERDERFRLEVQERAKLIKEREKQERKAAKKEKVAAEKVARVEELKKELKEKEEKKAAKLAKTE